MPAAKQPVKTADTAPKEAPKVLPAKFKVKNTHQGNLNLTNGTIKPGGTGIATIAEYSTLSQYMERV
ncbi:MAG: hypothetical protein DRQ35_00960 [Gammaproteobacteria bacterium]|nr:MAG: hypothetical protein DRQ35_00960 [Gammaproteobacteria bacterium]